MARKNKEFNLPTGVTPVVPSGWNQLVAPQTEYDGTAIPKENQKYTIQVTCPSEFGEQLVSEMKALFKEQYGTRKRAPTFQYPEPEEDGSYKLTFSKKAFKNKNGTLEPQKKPIVVDKNGEPLEPEDRQFYAGSLIQVSYFLQPWGDKLAGISSRIRAVMVIKPVYGGGGGPINPKDFGFTPPPDEDDEGMVDDPDSDEVTDEDEDF